MAFNMAGIIHYLAITCYFVHDYITVVHQCIINGLVNRLVNNYTSKLQLKIIICKLQDLFAR